MKLSYRGVSFDYEPLVMETTVGEDVGKYRGRDWRFRNLKKPPVLQPTVNLTYRGVKYNKPDTITARTVEPEKTTTVSTEQKARSLMVNHTRTIKNRQQAMLSRSATEIGFSARVSQYWNRIQGKIHLIKLDY